MKQSRYLIIRRVLQITILMLFATSSYFKWNILRGNYSSALFLDQLHLTDPYATLQMLLSGFIISSKIFIGALTVLVIYAFLGGRLFCSFVCPYNIISDTILFIRRKSSFFASINFKVSNTIRYYFLLLSLILSIVLGVKAFELVNPISILFRAIIFGIGSSWAVILGLVLFDLVVMKSGWCGHLCPIGAFYSIIGKFGVLKVYHKKDKCTLCNKCFDLCPEVHVLDIVGKRDGKIDLGDCTKCGRCIEICSDNALNFTNSYKKQ